MAGAIADKKTALICYSEVEKSSSKLKRKIEEAEEIVRFLTSAGNQEALSGGDGDLIIGAINNGVEVMQQVLAKAHKDLLEPLDGKIAAMKNLTSDKSDVSSKASKLKENAVNVASLKR